MRGSGGTARARILVACALLLAACQAAPSTSADPTGQGSSGSPAATGVASSSTGPTPVPSALPALPSAPAGWTPADGDPVISVLTAGDVCPADPCDAPVVALYPDGTLLDWRGATGPLPIARRLTPAGAGSLLELVRDSGLFEQSRRIPPAGPYAAGETTYIVAVTFDGRTRTVSAANGRPSDDGRRLIDLADRLIQLAGSMPASAYVGGDTNGVLYRPRLERLRLEVVSLPREPGWNHPVATVERLPWPFDQPPGSVGEDLDVVNAPERAVRCALVDGTLAARLRLALERSGLDPGQGAWELWWQAGSAIVTMDLRPVLPEEAPACDTTGLWEARATRRVPTNAMDIIEAGTGDPTALGAPLLEVLQLRQDAGGSSIRVRYLRGGTVVIDQPFAADAPVRVLTLSSAGLDAVLAAADDSGLLDRAASHTSPASPDMEIVLTRWCRPDCDNPVEVRADNRAGTVPAKRLMELGSRLADPAYWLPASVFPAGTSPRPYAPPFAYVIVALLPVPVDRPDALAVLPHLPPASAVALADGTALQALGRDVAFERWPGDEDPRTARCLVVLEPRAWVLELAAALAAVGSDHQRQATLGPGSYGTRAGWELRGDRPNTMVVVEVLVPDPFAGPARATCRPDLDIGFGW